MGKDMLTCCKQLDAIYCKYMAPKCKWIYDWFMENLMSCLYECVFAHVECWHKTVSASSIWDIMHLMKLTFKTIEKHMIQMCMVEVLYQPAQVDPSLTAIY
ncbi:hypothetical protein AMAG_19631 [Allomyces macrogynus ATCC 38327]|uniref:Uncharacterized protein n=1 Tax=Allomyces macrogynus (strain ATCC 38327) TaxID=578462 RepID=A0A0L0SYC0_ALLM3|nr:hypothetical protein AMAG_19631 [Allomyces macrogynus ATCC 38327]|eukprot:KNE67492.1 hypothetical protein AMAG_19631 [Allomyces macrogynus ATCC 38327]